MYLSINSKFQVFETNLKNNYLLRPYFFKKIDNIIFINTGWMFPLRIV